MEIVNEREKCRHHRVVARLKRTETFDMENSEFQSFIARMPRAKVISIPYQIRKMLDSDGEICEIAIRRVTLSYAEKNYNFVEDKCPVCGNWGKVCFSTPKMITISHIGIKGVCNISKRRFPEFWKKYGHIVNPQINREDVQ